MAKYVSVYTDVEVAVDEILEQIGDDYLLDYIKKHGLKDNALDCLVIETTRPITRLALDEAKSFLAKHYDLVKQ